MIKESFQYSTPEEFVKKVDSMRGAEVLYCYEGIVIIKVNTFEACEELFNTKTISWCIAQSEHHWNQYVKSKRNKQYFIVDFNNITSDDRNKSNEAFIGFTIDDEGGEYILYAAHAKNDTALLNITYKRLKGIHPFEEILKQKKIYNFVMVDRLTHKYMRNGEITYMPELYGMNNVVYQLMKYTILLGGIGMLLLMLKIVLRF